MTKDQLQNAVATFIRDANDALISDIGQMLIDYKRAEEAHEAKEDQREANHTGKKEYNRKPFKFPFSATASIVDGDATITNATFGAKSKITIESRITRKPDLVDMMEKTEKVTANV